MGSEIEPYDLYIPAPGEPGVVWGLRVAGNFNIINEQLQANATAIDDEATARQDAIDTAISEVEDNLAIETQARSDGDVATLATATGRAAALAIVFGS